MVRRYRPSLIAGGLLLAISLAVVGCGGQASGFSDVGKTGLLHTPFSFLVAQAPEVKPAVQTSQPSAAPVASEAIAPASEAAIPATSNATSGAQSYAGHYCSLR